LDVTTVGLRQLRQDASELVRRVEQGEQIDITVAGRLAARIVPAVPSQWQRWDAISDVFAGSADPDWETDREMIDQSVANPWEHDDQSTA
jgi:prevent-host-death family protein